MNERQAIHFEMQELKEQSRRDFDMYFELRKHRNQRYNELQNRLREIDERDMKAPQLPQIESNYHNPGLPTPKAQDFTVEQLRVDKYEEEITDGRTKRIIADYNEISETVEEFLRINGPSKLKSIKRVMERRFNKKWANYNSVLKKVMTMNKKVQVMREGKDNLYFYAKEDHNND
jgi:hypothetical protein